MLPFESIAEAESILGRDLTGAETFRFRYSAGMHDFWLYAHNTFFLLVVYTIAPLPIASIELTNPKPMRKYRLQPKVKISADRAVDCCTNAVKLDLSSCGGAVAAAVVSDDQGESGAPVR